jgi:hypothetical protein
MPSDPIRGERSLQISDQELVSLVERVFRPQSCDRGLAILTDLPDSELPDHAAWRDRRRLAEDWARRLAECEDQTGLATRFFTYDNAGANNADLPAVMTERTLQGDRHVATEEVFGDHSILMAITELSATAPLKVAAPHFGFRAATMPGFTISMIPALRIDYIEVDRRCRVLASLLDRASGADLHFDAAGEEHSLHLDLRYRRGHSSGGLLREPGTAGNLPSGESYIVPYEGERPGEPSRSQGIVPVEFKDGIVTYRIAGNRVAEVLDNNPAVQREREALAAEPAYGNIAELGLGVLSAFGIRPIGVVLLDEKLGPHIAFGRSDHFGGQVGPQHFSAPNRVVHIDRVYLPETQPNVRIETLVLRGADEGGGDVELIQNGSWILEYGTP